MSKKECTKLGKQWQVVLSEIVREVESVVQSSQRERKLSVEKLVQSLVLGCLEKGKVSLSTWVDVASDLGCEITKSSLDERLTGRLVLLLHEVLQASIKHRIDSPRLPRTKLENFKRVILYDSTRVTLSPIFKEVFKDTTPGHSSLKIQLGYDYLTAQFSHLALCSGVDPDQKDEGLLEQAEPESLICCDLGYFKQEHLRDMDQRDASFIIPLRAQVGVYDCQTEHRVDLATILQDYDGASYEAVFKIGAKVKHPLRIIAIRLPQQQAEKKRRHLKQRMKDSGYTASQDALSLCDWMILLTNLDPTWTVNDICLLYGIRWQIELVFKSWKSYLEIETGDFWRREPVFCQLLATLIAATLCQQTFALVRWIHHLETSHFRTIDRLRRKLQDLYRVIRRDWYGLTAWATQLRTELLKFARQQNLETHPSTLYTLMNKGLT